MPEEGTRSPETKVKMVVSHDAVVRNRTQILCKSSLCSELLSHLSDSGVGP